ncbi:MAG: hypothetical protein HOY71_36300 [Nonomuraea sp.]|nr:hypothetical protein [Nonomuraea sp.]
MKTPRRRTAIAVATLAIAAISTTACGIGNKVDCAQVSGEAQKIGQEFMSSMGSAATDPKAIEKAGQDASDKLKTLASKYDGELASALNDFADIYASLKVDDAAALQGVSAKVTAASTKLQNACS